MNVGLKIIVCIAAAVLWPRSSLGFDQEFLTHGADSKTHAGATATTSKGAPAVLYNPANLSLSRSHLEPYAEISVIHVRYEFTYPGHEPAGLNLTLPVPTFGVVGSPFKNFNLGMMTLVAPAEAQKTKIKKVPTRQLSTEPQLVDVEIGGGDGLSYLVGAGASYKVFNTSLGVSLVKMEANSSMELIDHQSQISVIDLNSSISSLYPMIGLRSFIMDHAVLGLSYQPEYKPTYHIESLADDGSSTKFKGRRGQQLRAGLETRFSIFETLSEVHYKEHSRDAGDVFAFLAEDAGNENIDTFSFMLGGGLRFPGLNIGYTYGHHPTYVGNGLMAERSKTNTEITGIQFGNLDGISRDVHSVYSRFDSPFGRHTCGGAYQTGTREVPEHARGFGSYSLDVFSISCGSQFRF